MAAAHLAASGYRRGDRVAVVTPEYATAAAGDAARDQSDALAVILGALRLGVVPVLVHPLLTAVEREYIVSDSGARGDVITPDRLASFAEETTAARPQLSDLPLARPMHYTSGTTGTPKGVVADLSESDAAAWWTDEMSHWEFARDDVTLVHSPLCHSAPLRFAIGTLLSGGSVALAGRFSVPGITAAMVALSPTTAFVVPSQLAMLLADGQPASPYRLLAHAGSACPPPLKRAVHDWAGAERTWEFYGSTEGQFTSCRGTEWEQRPGTIGRARAGRTLSTDDLGRIWCVAPRFARFEYWGDPGKTEAAWHDTAAGPAFTVGDLGRLDDSGYLFLEGRREDLIISGGVNVYPAEVEGVISGHPGVRDVAVFPVADAKWGHQVACAVVTDIDPDELATWARERLAGYKMPKRWIVVPALPRSSMGKIRRTAMAGELGLSP